MHIVQPTRRVDPTEILQISCGWVETCGPLEYQVHVGGAVVGAKRAASCLVAPAPGQRITLLELGSGEHFILAVLDRSSTGITITSEGDLDIHVPTGKLSLAVKEEIRLSSEKVFDVIAPKVRLAGKLGKFMFRRLHVVASRLTHKADSLKIVADTLDMVADHKSDSSRLSTRTVSELDSLRAGSVDYQATKMMTLRGEHVLAFARALVKMDGEQVHIG